MLCCNESELELICDEIINSSSGLCGVVVTGKDQLEKALLNLATESAVKMQDHVMGWGFKTGEVRGSLKITALCSDTRKSTTSRFSGQRPKESTMV